MKVKYTAETKVVLNAFCRITPGANRKDKFTNMGHSQRYMLQQMMHKAPEIGERLKELEALFRISWITPDITVKWNGADVTFRTSKSFKDREEMLTWAKSKGIKVPKECEKEGELSNSCIVTRVTHKAKATVDLTIELSYTRDGAPTPHCRVHTSTYNTVVCDIR